MKNEKVTLEEAMDRYVVFSDVQQVTIKGGNGSGDSGNDDDEEEVPEG